MPSSGLPEALLGDFPKFSPVVDPGLRIVQLPGAKGLQGVGLHVLRFGYSAGVATCLHLMCVALEH